MRFFVRCALSALVVLLALAFLAGPVAAENLAKKTKVKAELVADVDGVAPGQAFRIGVRFKIEKDWHIYWSNPGEAGLPTKVDFAATPGFTFGDVKYPEPELFGVGSPISGYGYEREVLLFTTATTPADLTGGSVEFKAQTSWLVCKHICLPGKATVSIKLPVIAAAKPGQNKARFDDTQQQIPIPASEVPGLKITHRFDVSAVIPDQEFSLLLAVEAPPGKMVAPRTDPKHAFLSPLKPTNYEVLKVAGEPPNQTPRRQIAVKLTALTWPELDKPEKIGGTFQLNLIAGGKKESLAVEYEIALPYAKAGTAVEKITLPELGGSTSAAPQPPIAPGEQPKHSLLYMLLFAFLGGIILNVMPCVLPVLSIKVMSVIKQSDMTHAEIRHHGIAYTVGILASFLAMATFVAILKSSGEAVGWGFQFQSPVFVGILAAIVFVFGLSMLDVFLINVPTSKAVHEAGGKEGLRGSFFNGIFATVLATPCTAPFLGTAVGFAFTQPIWITFFIFIAIAFGLAFPFLLLAFVPAWTRFMPKPGAWMETFKSVMAFLLMATVVWLLDVIGKQVGTAGMTQMIAYLGLLAFASWLYGRFGNITRRTRTRVLASLVAATIALGGGVTLLRFDPPAMASEMAVKKGGIQWERWSEKTAAALLDDGKTVFIDFTAAWCWTCKVNEKAVIETKEVKDTIARHGIVPLKGDFTNRDPEISAFLNRHGKAGVPVYAIIGPKTGGKAVILPEVLTREILIGALDKAAQGS